jgi:hypothetical protein
MTKLGSEQLGRKAYVYVRQSTPDQVQHHPESQRRQYGLIERARDLGFAEVELIDEDLGRSGGGMARPGFERLLAAICNGEAGAVLALECQFQKWLRHFGNECDTTAAAPSNPIHDTGPFPEGKSAEASGASAQNHPDGRDRSSAHTPPRSGFAWRAT